MQVHRKIGAETINCLGVRNQEMRRLKTELANKDAIIAGFEADRIQYQGTNDESLTLNVRLVFILLTFCLADAIIKAKEFAESACSLDRLRDENIELKKLNQSMTAELETAKKSLAKAEQTLETERQNHKDQTLAELGFMVAAPRGEFSRK